MHLSSVYHRAAQRTANRWHDLRAVAAGYCNHRPWHPEPDRSEGGYPHWRCSRRRGHKGYHRSVNYVWLDDLHVEYAPVVDAPGQPWKRYMIPSLRDTRTAKRWVQRQHTTRA